MANTKKRVISLFMALVMTLGLLPISAMATEYTEGATFTAATSDAALPGGIPENCHWAGPVETAESQELVCEKAEHTHVTQAVCTHEHNKNCKQEVWVPCTRENNPSHYNEWGHKWNEDDYDYDKRGYGSYQETISCTHNCSQDENCITEDQFCAVECALAHTHEGVCFTVTPAFFTWTVALNRAESVAIRDDIVNSGTLVAEVTGYAESYQWYKNGEEISGATGAVLNAFDNENHVVITAPNKYTVKAFANGSEATSGAYAAKYYTDLQNGGFEKPAILGGETHEQYANNEEPEMYWLSTGIGQYPHVGADIELVKNGSSPHFTQGKKTVAEGKQCAEVNAEAYGALYQDVLTQPGATLHWGFAHRGRSGDDKLVLVIINERMAGDIKDFGNVDKEYIKATVIDGASDWHQYAGEYQVPEGQYLTRFYFAAVDAAGGSSQGNLLDDVTFSTTPPAPKPEMQDYTINYFVDEARADTETGRADLAGTVSPSKLAQYENYDANANNAIEMVIVQGENVLNLYYTTPAYTVEYYTNGKENTSEYTQITTPAGAPDAGKAIYGATMDPAGVPDEMIIDNNKFVKEHTSDTTMSKTNKVLKIYYNFEAPVVYTVNYDWTTENTIPSGVTLPENNTKIPNLEEYTAQALPLLTAEQQAEGYSITGWYDGEDGLTLFDPADGFTDGMTLYAKGVYTEPSKYSVTYEWATDSAKPETLPKNQNNITLKALQEIVLPTYAPLTEGYTFAGWYTSADHSVKFTDETLEKQTASITLYAYFTYNAPTRKYSVNYELYTATNGGAYSQTAIEEIVDEEAVTEEACPTLENLVVPDTYKGYTKGTATDDKTKEGTWGENSLVFTVKYYAKNYTVGSLKISKTISGLDDASKVELAQNLTFTVDGPDGNSREIPYSEFKEDSYTLTTLEPGTYTVTENDADVAGYTRKTTGTMTVEVKAQAASAAIAITNTYTSKEYTITFDAVANGQINQEGPFEGTKTFEWTEFEPDDDPIRFGWASLDSDTEGSKFVYRFSYADYLQYNMVISKPHVAPNAGYTTALRFDEFDSIKTSIESMNLLDTTEVTYCATYTADKNTGFALHQYYQMADGTFAKEEHFFAEAIRTGTTDTNVQVKAADKSAEQGKGLKTVTYVYDATNEKNVLTKNIAGDGSTELVVHFKWQAGVTYRYLGATDAIMDNYPLPSDTEKYDRGVNVSNKGKEETYTDATGTWTLAWDKTSDNMTAAGIEFVGTWSFAAAGQATVSVQFVDESGNKISAAHQYSMTADYSTPYEFSTAENVKALENNGYSYTFLNDYDGAFEAGHQDEEVRYSGNIPVGGRSITRVYSVDKIATSVEKAYSNNISALPSGFAITVTDKATGAHVVTLTLANATATAGKLTWTTDLPIGRSYTFTESNYANGAYWSTVLTAQQATAIQGEGGYAWGTVVVNGFAFDTSPITKGTASIILQNTYTYDSPDNGGGFDPEPPTDPVVEIPEEPTPTTDLPDGEVPLTDLPETEVPLAEVPATGDTMIMWAMAAVVSGLGLVWLVLSGKKREEEAE